MTVAAILKVLSLFWKQALEFMRKYWMQIIGVMICIGLVWAGYAWGYNVADSKWIVANNKQVGELNAKIGRLEKQAAAASLKAQGEKKDLEDRLKTIVDKTPPIFVHDQAGVVVKCDNKTVPVYLGPEFKKAWNKINAESNK